MSKVTQSKISFKPINSKSDYRDNSIISSQCSSQSSSQSTGDSNKDASNSESNESSTFPTSCSSNIEMCQNDPAIGMYLFTFFN